MLLRGEPWKSGTVRNVTLTVVPSDEAQLWCFGDQDLDGFSCGATGAKRLAPYVTVQKELIVLSNVFSHPSVKKEAMRREHLRGANVRYRVTCRIRHLDYAEQIGVRFGLRAKVTPARAWIAATEDCQALASH